MTTGPQQIWDVRWKRLLGKCSPMCEGKRRFPAESLMIPLPSASWGSASA